jgi:hypothetical protein
MLDMPFATERCRVVALHARETSEALRSSLFIGLKTRWFRLDYLDESGRACRAYFADGSSRGFSGFFGGTDRLDGNVVAFFQPQPNGPQASPPSD